MSKPGEETLRYEEITEANLVFAARLAQDVLGIDGFEAMNLMSFATKHRMLTHGYIVHGNEDVVGLVGIKSMMSMLAEGHPFKLMFIGVIDKFRRRGIGEKIVKDMTSLVGHWGGTDIYVAIDSDNSIGGLFFHLIGWEADSQRVTKDGRTEVFYCTEINGDHSNFQLPYGRSPHAELVFKAENADGSKCVSCGDEMWDEMNSAYAKNRDGKMAIVGKFVCGNCREKIEKYLSK